MSEVHPRRLPAPRRAPGHAGAPPLQGLLLDELEAFYAPLGLSARDTRRVMTHLLAEDRVPFTVPNIGRDKLARARDAVSLPTLEIVDRRASPTDGFTKYLFRLHDGHTVEAVRIPIFDKKYTLCVSSQAGCPLACAFCATGRMGLLRSLAAWEIVEQVRLVRREADRPVRGIVFMGMGEPFLNYEEVVRAARILSAPWGLAISGKAITISTAGVVPAIQRYTREGWPFRLAISLTAATSEQRRALMPVEKTYPLAELVDAIRAHAADRRELVTLEYVLISGVNCGVEDARALKALLDGIPVRLNLIEVNDATGRFQPPGAAELAAFRDALQVLGAPIVRRYSGGKDVDAACGMLAAVTGPPRTLPILR
jgi:23S rRNA (adenine2503-C2)-methyltransferase